jgi:hypothetical protein
MLGVLLPLDVLHVNGESRVIRILPDLKPWRVGPYVLRSTWVLELPTGTVARTATQLGILSPLKVWRWQIGNRQFLFQPICRPRLEPNSHLMSSLADCELIAGLVGT